MGVDDALYLFKNGHFRRLPEPNHQPLGLVVGMAEDTDGNIWAVCAGTRGSWFVSAISRSVKSSLHRKFHRGIPWLRIHMGESG